MRVPPSESCLSHFTSAAGRYSTFARGSALDVWFRQRSAVAVVVVTRPDRTTYVPIVIALVRLRMRGAGTSSERVVTFPLLLLPPWSAQSLAAVIVRRESVGPRINLLQLRPTEDRAMFGDVNSLPFNKQTKTTADAFFSQQDSTVSVERQTVTRGKLLISRDSR